MLELVFTSARNGLIPGRSGFCSVAWTEGMPQSMVNILENMSGYNALYAPDDPMAAQNPVCYSYQKVQFGRSVLRVVSRIAFAGLDYTGRSNKIAHHIVLDDELEFKRMKHGPISLFLGENNFFTEWNEPPRLLPLRKKLNIDEAPDTYAGNWQAVAGDARWAGYIADIFENQGDQGCIYLEYDHLKHGENILRMIDEVTRLLPPEKARELTFTTCFSSAQNGCSCFFRAALPSSSALPAIRRFKAKDLISAVHGTAWPENVPDSKNILKAQGKEFRPIIKVPSREKATGDITLTLHDIATSPSAPPPPPDSVISLDESSINSFVTSDSGKKYDHSRLIVFLLIASVLMLGIIGGIVYMIFGSADGENGGDGRKDDGRKVVIADSQSTKLLPPLPTDSSEKPDSSAKSDPQKKPDSSAKSDPQKKPDPSVEKPSPKTADRKKSNSGSPRKNSPSATGAFRNGSIPVKDRYHMLRDFLLGTKNKTLITLPASLRGAEKIDIELKNKWGNSGELDVSEHIERKGNKDIKVYPLHSSYDKSGPDKSSKNYLHITLESESIQITDHEADLTPNRKHILSITFIQGTKKVNWVPEFDKDFISHIAKGKINDKLVYDRSDEEKLFAEYISIQYKGIDDFKKAESLIVKWNEKINEINALQEKWKNYQYITLEEFESKYKIFEKRLEWDTIYGKKFQQILGDVAESMARLEKKDLDEWLKENNFKDLRTFQNRLIGIFAKRLERHKNDHKECCKIVGSINKNRDKLSENAKKVEDELKKIKKDLSSLKRDFHKIFATRSEFREKFNADFEKAETWNLSSENKLEKLSFTYDDVIKYVQDNRDKFIEIKAK